MQYPVIKNAEEYKRVTDSFFDSLAHKGPHFYIPQYVVLSKRLELEYIVADTLGSMIFPKLGEDNIVDKHFGRNSFTEDGEVIPDRLSPFEKADIVRYHLFELSYISVVTILETFIFDVCRTVTYSLHMEDKEATLRKIGFGGFSGCISFLDQHAKINSTELLKTVEKEISIMKFRRNCMVHNLGIIEDHNFEKMGYNSNQVGQKVMIDFEELMKACFHVGKTARLIDIRMIEVYGKDFWEKPE